MPMLADRCRQPFGHANEPNAPILRRRQFAAPVGVPHPDLPSFEIDVGPFECHDFARPQPGLASEEGDEVAARVDRLLGDPTYAWHPIRIVGRALTWAATRLRAAGLNGYLGGVLQFVWLALVAVGTTCVGIVVAARAPSALAWLIHAFVVYGVLALGALLRHVWRIDRALRAGNLLQARSAVSEVVGRDTDQMDAGACRRAAVESL